MPKAAPARAVQPQASLFDEALAPLHVVAPAPASGYSAKDIEVLEGLEPVRKRPGMYIGGVDERALHHLFAEVLDNAMDEAVAGHATRIEIELAAGDWVTVRDNGRGIPVDPHPRFPDLALVGHHRHHHNAGAALQSSRKCAVRPAGQCNLRRRSNI